MKKHVLESFDKIAFLCVGLFVGYCQAEEWSWVSYVTYVAVMFGLLVAVSYSSRKLRIRK